VAQTSARRVALAALKTWRTKKQFVDSVIAPALSKSALRSSDRAFALELFYGVLRNLTLLNFWIRELRPQHVDVDLRDALQLGLYQIFLARIPEHAAVNETVELVPNTKRGIVNAILRTATRNRKALQKSANAQSLDVRASHPKFLIERWQKTFGEESSETLCNWNNQPPPIYARINHLKVDRQTFLERYCAARTLSNIPNFVELPAPVDALEAGNCYVQDPSTAIACELLQPQPGEKLLDACAAPGGKTSYLAELMRNRGSIIACDRDPERLRLLEENLQRLGVRIAKIVRHDWTNTKVPDEILSEAPFDRVLLDAPCSNTGVMRRRVDVRWRLKPTDFGRMQKRQIEIALAVTPLLKPGGILVYSTCSLESEENAGVVECLLRNMSILTLEEERRSLPFIDNFDGAYAARLQIS